MKINIYDHETEGKIGSVEMIFSNRGEAEKVLDELNDLITHFGQVNVADLFELAGVMGVFDDCKYGWSDLSTVAIGSSHLGYILNLPRTNLL